MELERSVRAAHDRHGLPRKEELYAGREGDEEHNRRWIRVSVADLGQTDETASETRGRAYADEHGEAPRENGGGKHGKRGKGEVEDDQRYSRYS